MLGKECLFGFLQLFGDEMLYPDYTSTYTITFNSGDVSHTLDQDSIVYTPNIAYSTDGSVSVSLAINGKTVSSLIGGGLYYNGGSAPKYQQNLIPVLIKAGSTLTVKSSHNTGKGGRGSLIVIPLTKTGGG